MRKITLFSILFVTLFIGISGQRPNNIQKDYKVFYTALHEKEGVLNLHTNQDSIEYYFNQLEEGLQRSATLQEDFKLFSNALQRLQCGHTQIYPNKKVLKEWLAERRSLPIDYYLDDLKLLISKLDYSDYETSYADRHNKNQIQRIPSNSEILEIDHKTVQEMMIGIGAFISSDEDQLEFKYHQAGQLFEFYRHLAYPFTKDTIQVKYTDGRDTNEVHLIVGAAPVHTMNKRIAAFTSQASSYESEIGEFKIIKSKYGYFRFHSFVACGGEQYRAFLNRSFSRMKRDKINKLVIDLRGNTGGIMQYDLISYFVGPDVVLGKYIVEKPSFSSSNKYIKKMGFDYIRHWRMSVNQKRMERNGKFNEGIIKSAPKDSSILFKGDVVVITDEGTFSSASILACHLKSLANAKIIGRPAGGSFYKGNSGTLQVILPKTGFILLVNPNTFYSQLDPFPEDPLLIKEPDVYIDPFILDDRKKDALYFKRATYLFSDN